LADEQDHLPTPFTAIGSIKRISAPPGEDFPQPNLLATAG
jgi:hypothetical protein